jgi:predicted AlkP superfamily phosphohydrolase/phosphomutase
MWSVRGIGKFLVLQDQPHIRIYLTPIGTDPVHSFIPISDPEEFAENIQREQGYFCTVGWSHDTSAVDAGILPDDYFLRQVLDTMDFEQRLLLSELQKKDWDLLISIGTATDRAAHMFWRYLDPHHPRYDSAAAERLGQPLKTVYQKMDEMVGRVMERISDDVHLIVMSDHGFHAFRRGFNLNTWLVEQGFMAFRGLPERTLPDPISEESFFPNVEWRRSKAYAIGTGAVYLNLRGREQQGSVSPGDEASQLLQDIKNRLANLKDPATNISVFSDIYLGSDIFKGSANGEAPDLQLAYADGYRGSSKSLLGGFARDLLEDNRDAWSGDHSASDVNDTNGILLTNNRAFSQARLSVSGNGSPAIVDLAPTILAMFGLTPPDNMVGSKLV